MIRKVFISISFILATIVISAIIMTATTFTQLGIGALLYLPLAYLTFELFPRKPKQQQQYISTTQPVAVAATLTEEQGESIDIDRRAFLKLIGVAGLSFFLMSLFSKKAETLLLGKVAQSETTGLENAEGTKINPSERQPMDGFQISEVDDDVVSYYGFMNKDGQWIIMRDDTENSSFRYAKGDSDFPGNWSKRTQIVYDYFSNIF
jgi:hypothetical protein